MSDPAKVQASASGPKLGLAKISAREIQKNEARSQQASEPEAAASQAASSCDGNGEIPASGNRGPSQRQSRVQADCRCFNGQHEHPQAQRSSRAMIARQS